MLYTTAYDGQNLVIEEVEPAILSHSEITDRAMAIGQILASSWEHKFVPTYLSQANVTKKIPSLEDQVGRIERPTTIAEYLLAYTTTPVNGRKLVSPEDGQAFIRVAEYKPRNPFGASYPNVTDLETRDGRLHGLHENAAAALLFWGLNDYQGKLKTSAYSELPNKDGIAFFEDLGYKQTGNQPQETIGDQVMTYVHLEASRVADVRANLRTQYPWL